jgi:hypothetical protein
MTKSKIIFGFSLLSLILIITSINVASYITYTHPSAITALKTQLGIQIADGKKHQQSMDRLNAMAELVERVNRGDTNIPQLQFVGQLEEGPKVFRVAQGDTDILIMQGGRIEQLTGQGLPFDGQVFIEAVRSSSSGQPAISIGGLRFTVNAYGDAIPGLFTDIRKRAAEDTSLYGAIAAAVNAFYEQKESRRAVIDTITAVPGAEHDSAFLFIAKPKKSVLVMKDGQGTVTKLLDPTEEEIAALTEALPGEMKFSPAIDWAEYGQYLESRKASSSGLLAVDARTITLNGRELRVAPAHVLDTPLAKAEFDRVVDIIAESRGNAYLISEALKNITLPYCDRIRNSVVKYAVSSPDIPESLTAYIFLVNDNDKEDIPILVMTTDQNNSVEFQEPLTLVMDENELDLLQTELRDYPEVVQRSWRPFIAVERARLERASSAGRRLVVYDEIPLMVDSQALLNMRGRWGRFSKLGTELRHILSKEWEEFEYELFDEETEMLLRRYRPSAPIGGPGEEISLIILSHEGKKYPVLIERRYEDDRFKNAQASVVVDLGPSALSRISEKVAGYKKAGIPIGDAVPYGWPTPTAAVSWERLISQEYVRLAEEPIYMQVFAGGLAFTANKQAAENLQEQYFTYRVFNRIESAFTSGIRSGSTDKEMAGLNYPSSEPKIFPPSAVKIGEETYVLIMKLEQDTCKGAQAIVVRRDNADYELGIIEGINLMDVDTLIDLSTQEGGLSQHITSQDMRQASKEAVIENLNAFKDELRRRATAERTAIRASSAGQSTLDVFGINQPATEKHQPYEVPAGDRLLSGTIANFPAAIDEIHSDDLTIEGFREIVDMLNAIQSAYKRAAAEDSSVKKQAESNIWYIMDTVTDVTSISMHQNLADELKKNTTLLLDKDALLPKQLEMAQRIGELDKIKQVLGCEIIFTDAKTIPANIDPNTTIAITGSANAEVFQKAGARVINIGTMKEGQYLPLTPLAIFAKAMLSIEKGTMPRGKFRSMIQNLYKYITKGDFVDAQLQEYANTFIINVALPAPDIVYQDGELEQLHRQALALLIAA